MLQHELPIVGEVKQPVEHNLLVLAGTTRDMLRRVYSHPQGLRQCERFLRTLNALGYDGPLTVEREYSADQKADLEQALELLVRLRGKILGA